MNTDDIGQTRRREKAFGLGNTLAGRRARPGRHFAAEDIATTGFCQRAYRTGVLTGLSSRNFPISRLMAGRFYFALGRTNYRAEEMTSYACGILFRSHILDLDSGVD